jgi:hypothetical protein
MSLTSSKWSLEVSNTKILYACLISPMRAIYPVIFAPLRIRNIIFAVSWMPVYVLHDLVWPLLSPLHSQRVGLVGCSLTNRVWGRAGPPAGSGRQAISVDSCLCTEMSRRQKYQHPTGSMLGDVDPAKARVLQQLAEGRLVATRHHKARFSGISGVWAKFSLLVRPYSDEPVGFVQCNGCQGVLRYDSHRTGTSSLKRHGCMRNLNTASCKDIV